MSALNHRKTAMLSLSLLGKVELTANGQAPNRPITVKAVALLSYLVVTQQTHSRATLMGLLWGDSPEAKAQTSLRVALSALRKWLPDYLVADRTTVRLRLDQPIWCDVRECERLLADGNVIRAANLMHGDFMRDFRIDGAPTFDAWLEAQRTHWREQTVACLIEVADRHAHERAYTQAVPLLQQVLEIEPWHEASHRNLMLAYCRLRNFNGALAQYERCRDLLAVELGVPPMPATTELYERVLQARLAHSPVIPHEPTPLISRTDDIATLHAQLLHPDCRLLTIIGLGGMGKTRLAMAVGQQIAQENVLTFLDGVTFVPLQAVQGGQNAVARAIATALDVSLPGRRSASAEIADYLQPEERLLILDNFEQLTATAGWLDHLLRVCPSLKLLVTSRVALNLAVERRYPLTGLPLPAAVQLLTQAQHGTANENACLQRLCQLVEGVPLAIKLAGQWLTTLSCERVLSELERNLDILATQMADIPPRQRSMRAIFEQTWHALTEVEQSVLSALSIFRGGFAEDAALSLSACSIWTLKQLRDRGLVNWDGERFSLHELVRQFSAEKRHTHIINKQVVREHAIFYAHLVATAVHLLITKERFAVVRRLRPDLDNIRLAWRTAITQREVATLDLMLVGWARLLTADGLEDEGIDLLQPALDLYATLPPSTSNLTTWARLLLWFGRFCHAQNQLSRAEIAFTRLRDIADTLNSTLFEAQGLAGLSRVMLDQDNYKLGVTYAEQGLILAEALGNWQIQARIHNTLGLLIQAGGQAENALNSFRKSIELAILSDNEWLSASPSVNLGFVLISLGHYDEAETTLQAVLVQVEANGWRRGLGLTLYHLGRLHWFKGDHALAIDYFERSRHYKFTADDRARVDRNLARLSALRGQFDHARQLARHALRIHQQVENASSIGIDYVQLGMIELLADNYSLACSHLQQAISILTNIGRKPIFEYANLAYAYVQAGEVKSAETTILTGLKAAQKTASKRELLWLSAAMAAYWAAQGEPQQAQTLLQMVVSAQVATADNKTLARQIAARNGIRLTDKAAPLPDNLSNLLRNYAPNKGQ